MITLDLDSSTEKKFQKLLNALGKKYSALIDSMHQYRVQELEKGIKNLNRELLVFETKYDSSSVDFYKKYQNGEFGEDSDTTDFLTWSAYFESLIEFKTELKKLR
jgi:hypothetical protein